MTAAATLAVRVARKRQEAQDIVSFELVDAAGAALPAFSAGAHVDVLLPDGMTRQYSLCNDPAQPGHYLIGVLKDPASRGGSRALHESVHEGDTLTISAPRNHFALVHEAQRSLLLAGGIGITPVLCMAHRLAVAGQDFALHYCARSAARAAFLEHLRHASFASRVHFHFDAGPPGPALDLHALLSAPEDGTHVYVCGPKGFMDTVLSTARARGWPAAQLHYEFFGAQAAEPAGNEQAFEVQLASSGRIIVVPGDRSVVEALDEAGVVIPTSCAQGVCGTCLTRVIAGEPAHRDLYLTPEEQAANDQFLPCCSRAKSRRLVLDL